MPAIPVLNFRNWRRPPPERMADAAFPFAVHAARECQETPWRHPSVAGSLGRACPLLRAPALFGGGVRGVYCRVNTGGGNTRFGGEYGGCFHPHRGCFHPLDPFTRTVGVGFLPQGVDYPFTLSFTRTVGDAVTVEKWVGNASRLVSSGLCSVHGINGVN